eukprot:967196-Amphidinium_carterae.1
MIGHHSPFMAVYGRPASLLPPFEEGRPLQVVDDNRVRLREVATQSIINEVAKDRIARADHRKTRPAIELEDLRINDPVDIYFPSTNKEVEGWRGPAKVVSIQATEGNITVRYQ